ncbi:hypothetical protein SAMD00019534_020130, partial [Acytostelium subglobosum LB1]|uniref:hypothetical protein n=1 Tax=Acytostelium subglobosum LB1 TaxID=1410327 RepID=UPI000644B9B6
ESPIIGDWGFYNVANASTSLSTTTITKLGDEPVVFCTDDQCGSSKYQLMGYYYALFPALPGVMMTLSQTFTLFDIDTSKQTFILEYLVSSSVLQAETFSSMKVLVDDTVVYVSIGSVVYGDLQRINLLDYINITSSGANGYTHTLTFAAEFVGSSSPSSYYQISSVVVRRVPLTTSDLLSQDVYVDVAKGSDKQGTGAINAPFSTLGTALQWTTPGYTIHLQPGVYCGLSMATPLLQTDLNIQSVSGDPTNTVLHGQWLLSAFQVAPSQPTKVSVQGITITNTYASARSPGGGALFVEGTTNVTFTNCIFSNNVDSANLGAILLRGPSNTVLNLVQCTINNCSTSTSQQSTPAVNVLGFDSFQALTIANSQFTDNTYSLFVDQTNAVDIHNTTFVGTSRASTSLCSVQFSRSDYVAFRNNTLTQHSNCALCVINSNVYMVSSSFDHNYMTFDGPGANIFVSQNSIVNITDGSITDSTATSGTALFVMENSNVNINTLYIRDVSTVSSFGAIISASESSMEFNDLTIENSTGNYMFYLFYSNVNMAASSITRTVGGIWATQSTVLLTDSTFSEIEKSPAEDYIYLYQECRVSVTSCTFSQHGASTIHYLALTVIDLNQINVLNNSGTFIKLTPMSFVEVTGGQYNYNMDSIFSQQGNSYLTIVNVSFAANQAVSGAVINQQMGATASVYSSIFTNNIVSNKGGCVYIGPSSSTTLTNCTMSGNRAEMGGVIAAGDNATLTLYGGQYFDNIAVEGGGVIFYTTNVPTFIDVPVFTNNNATYGPVMATPPTYLQLMSPFPINIVSNITQFSGRVAVLDNLNQVVAFSEPMHKVLPADQW